MLFLKTRKGEKYSAFQISQWEKLAKLDDALKPRLCLTVYADALGCKTYRNIQYRIVIMLYTTLLLLEDVSIHKVGVHNSR